MKYIVFNKTDGITASPDTFSSIKKAEQFVKSFRERFNFQGYYFTSKMQRIDPKDVILEIVTEKEFYSKDFFDKL